MHGCPVEYKILITRDDGSGTMVDYDTSTAIHGTNYYEQVIYYTDTEAQVFDFNTRTWWEQANYYANGNAI